MPLYELKRRESETWWEKGRYLCVPGRPGAARHRCTSRVRDRTRGTSWSRWHSKSTPKIKQLCYYLCASSSQTISSLILIHINKNGWVFTVHRITNSDCVNETRGNFYGHCSGHTMQQLLPYRKNTHKQTSQKPVPSVILQSCSHTAFTRHIDEKLPGPLWKNHLKSFYLFIAHCSPFMLSPWIISLWLARPFRPANIRFLN